MSLIHYVECVYLISALSAYIFNLTILEIFLRLSFCSFTVTDPPEITLHPQNRTTTEGNSVTFSCEAIGNPSPSISWTKDASPLSNIGDPRITFTELNRKLTITNVDRADGGEYRCVASNSLGHATSNPATLNVQCMLLLLLLFLFFVFFFLRVVKLIVLVHEPNGI